MDYGGLAILLFLAVILLAIVWLLVLFTNNGLKSIENPTERGLVYVAMAIVAHAFLSAKSEK